MGGGGWANRSTVFGLRARFGETFTVGSSVVGAAGELSIVGWTKRDSDGDVVVCIWGSMGVIGVEKVGDA